MEKMETKALNVLLNCKSVGRSLEEKVLQRVLHKIHSEDDAGQVFPGRAGMDGPSLKKLWGRHHPEHSEQTQRVHGRQHDGESVKGALNQLV